LVRPSRGAGGGRGCGCDELLFRQRRRDRTVAEINSKGGKAIAIQGDVGKAADVKRLFEETEKALGSPSVLVNNAGVFQFEPFEAKRDSIANSTPMSWARS
jgi:NAD(P)-dependent dehydrogenase (short-subunit alcohol dehydrogenase family)